MEGHVSSKLKSDLMARLDSMAYDPSRFVFVHKLATLLK